MTKDFMEDQIVPLTAEAEIGYNWADLISLPNNASVELIEEKLGKLDGK
jgi:hypothetical protein